MDFFKLHCHLKIFRKPFATGIECRCLLVILLWILSNDKIDNMLICRIYDLWVKLPVILFVFTEITRNFTHKYSSEFL